MENESKLKEELEKTKALLKEIQDEKLALQKAIWDMLNYANLF